MFTVTASTISRADTWRNHAACYGEFAALFYPPLQPERRSAKNAREAQAKAVCATCEVREACLQHAIAFDERYGIWGGMTDRERLRHAAKQ